MAVFLKIDENWSLRKSRSNIYWFCERCGAEYYDNGIVCIIHERPINVILQKLFWNKFFNYEPMDTDEESYIITNSLSRDRKDIRR